MDNPTQSKIYFPSEDGKSFYRFETVKNAFGGISRIRRAASFEQMRYQHALVVSSPVDVLDIPSVASGLFGQNDRYMTNTGVKYNLNNTFDEDRTNLNDLFTTVNTIST